MFSNRVSGLMETTNMAKNRKNNFEDDETKRILEAVNIADAEFGKLLKKIQNRNSCSVCGMEALRGCSNCYIDYCSAECQNRDWPEHKAKCSIIASELRKGHVKEEPVEGHVKEEPVDEYPIEDEFEMEQEPPAPLFNEDPNFPYRPIPIDPLNIDHRRVVEEHLRNHVPQNGETNPHFFQDPRINRNIVNNRNGHVPPQNQVSRDPRLKLERYRDRIEPEPEPEPVPVPVPVPQYQFHPVFSNGEPPPLFVFNNGERHPPAPPRHHFNSLERQPAPASPELRINEPQTEPLFRRREGPSNAAPIDHQPENVTRESEPSLFSRERQALNRSSIFKPPIRRSDPPPRPPPGPMDEYISIGHYSDDAEMPSEQSDDSSSEREYRSHRDRDRTSAFSRQRERDRDRDREKNRDRYRERDRNSDRDRDRDHRDRFRNRYYRGRKTSTRGGFRSDKSSSRRGDIPDFEYGRTKKVFPPLKYKVVGLVKEDDDRYWVVEHYKYEKWKEIQQQVALCSESPVIPPLLNTVGACNFEGSWYRGKVVAVRPGIKIQFIDFGNTCEYDGKIRDIPFELRKTKPMAFMIKFSKEVPRYKLSRDLSGKIFDIEVTETCEKVSICRLTSDTFLAADTSFGDEEEEPQFNIKQEPGLGSDVGMDVDNDDVAVLEFLNLNNNTVVFMTDIYTMNEVFVRPADETFLAMFEKLNLDVQEYAQTVRPYVVPPKIGELCCARFNPEKNYRRALVQTENDDVCTLFFVDYGVEQGETHVKYIRPLSEELKRFPYCAVKVPLKGVIAEVRPKDAILYLNRLISNKLELILSYEHDIPDGVLLTENASGVVVNDYVNRIIVKEIQKTELYFERDLNFVTLEPGTKKNLAVTYIDKDEFDKYGVFYMADPKHPHYKKVMDVYPPLIRDYLFQNRDEYSPQEGELVLGKYQGDWYRAINVEQLSEEMFRVFFIDYGNEGRCHIRHIRKIRKDFAEAPCQAIKCTIEGCQGIPADTELHKDIFEYLDSNISHVLLNVKIYKCNDEVGRSALTYVKIPEVEKVLPKDY